MRPSSPIRGPQRTDFQYDKGLDIVIATPRWVIATPQDVTAWYQAYVDYFEPFGRRLDVIYVLDHFEVKAVVGSLWGEHRTRQHERFTRFTVRVSASRTVRTFVSTSAARFNGPAQEANSVAEASQVILALRRQEGLSQPPR